MASNNISKYYKVDSGLDLTSDSQFATLSANEKIVYKPSGEKYIKNSNYPNVFDKTDTFGELEEKVDTNIARLEEKVDTKVTKLEEKVDTKVIAKIDDADGNGVCSCKNNNNTQIDTFTCHISKTSNNPTLSWGQESTIGTIDGTPLTVKMPGNPNTDTKYSAGTGLTLNGATFYINENWLKTFIKDNKGGSGDDYTKGERYGDKWYKYGSGDGLVPSSSIYSEIAGGQIGPPGCGGYQHEPYHLSGDNPPSGTYYCEVTWYNSEDNVSGCYIYRKTV